MNNLEKLWDKINKSSTCWFWFGAIDKDGYGIWTSKKKTYRVHRFMYELYNGKILSGMVIDHLCRIRNCVNPEHLRAITNKENILCGVGITAQNSRKIVCNKGHDLSGKNLYVYKNKKGGVDRHCLKCDKERARILRDRQK